MYIPHAVSCPCIVFQYKWYIMFNIVWIYLKSIRKKDNLPPVSKPSFVDTKLVTTT